MKKILAVVLIISVVCFAGSAFARGRNNNNIRNNNNNVNVQQANCEFYGDFAGHHGGGPRSMFAPDMPQEIREKATEIAKLHIDLDEALTSQPLNKTKAREVYGKMLKLQQELDVWRFEKYLNDVENFYKQPAPQAPEASEAK